MNSSVKLKGKQIISGSTARASVMLVSWVCVSVLFGIIPSLPRYSPDSPLSPFLKLGADVLILFVSSLILMSLRLGSEAWFFGRAGGLRVSALYVFYWFRPSKAFKCAAFTLSVFFRKLFWFVLFMLPGLSILGGTAYTVLYRDGMSRALLCAFVSGGGAASFIGLIFFFIMIQRYFIADALKARYPDKKAKAVIRQSVNAMDGSCLKTFLFKFSFLPWFLLCILIFPALYVWPYYRESCSCLKSRIIYSYRKRTEKRYTPE
ncbi:MAG: DUF975 family protein [Clostridiales bacterium]|nr:DUF975 family protein [Clostridiales bacterium]